jgi:DNA-binding response OmpR family regulator
MPKKILIVDDEPYVRTLLKRALEDLEDKEVELLLACHGQEALDMVNKEQPDLLVLDVMMPHLSGYEVCEQVKALNKEIYVMLLTAKGQAIDKIRGAEAGADEYLTKPFNPDYILEQVATVLGVKL